MHRAGHDNLEVVYSRSSRTVLIFWVGSVQLQIKHRKPALDHAERTAPHRRHELDQADRENICPEESR